MKATTVFTGSVKKFTEHFGIRPKKDKVVMTEDQLGPEIDYRGYEADIKARVADYYGKKLGLHGFGTAYPYKVFTFDVADFGY